MLTNLPETSTTVAVFLIGTIVVAALVGFGLGWWLSWAREKKARYWYSLVFAGVGASIGLGALGWWWSRQPNYTEAEAIAIVAQQHRPCYIG